MDVVQFQEKLRELCELGQKNGKSLTHEQIQKQFEHADLETSQMVKILQYLKLQGIVIEGEEAAFQGEEADNASEEAKETGTKIPLTAEEEAYLKEYLQELGDVQELEAEAVRELFGKLSQGDALAEAALVRAYLPVAAQMAADMNCEELYLGDLIQEGNVVLLTALSSSEPERKDDAWLRLQIRKGIIQAIEEQTQQKFRDDCLVAKVEKLEAAVKDLTDDDGENRFTVDELGVILDMKVDEIRDILRLTGDDK